MKLYQKLLFFFLLVPVFCSAQDWKTVVLDDTAYFRGGGYVSGVHNALNINDTGYLRSIFVDSLTAQGNDSIFYFPRTVRGKHMYSCVDMDAWGWLGKMLIRKSDGQELYINGNQDTITFYTKAEINDSWLLGKDKTGTISFIGTVVQKNDTIINGIADSTKTISIQAIQNANPVANTYNNRVFKTSKYHGWLATLDLFCFPNDSFYFASAPVVDAFQYNKLPRQLEDFYVDSIDLQWKYTAGNAWIHRRSYYNFLFINQTWKYDLQYDSVINTLLLPNGILQVELFTIEQHTQTGHQSSDTMYFSTQYLSASAAYPMMKSHLPEYSRTAFLRMPTKYFMSSLCDKPIITVISSKTQSIKQNSTCYQWAPAFPHDTSSGYRYLQGFGLVLAYYYSFSDWPSTIDDRSYYSYLRLGTCIAGQREFLLSAENMNLPKRTFNASPNPASNHVTVSTTSSINKAVVTLTDITGRTLSAHTFSGTSLTIPLTLPSGIYLVTISSDEERLTQKLVVTK